MSDSTPTPTYPSCVYCGFADHPPVYHEHECPDSMGYDAASVVQTRARWRQPIKPPEKNDG